MTQARALKGNYRPRIEMVPMSLWGANMRALTTQTEWRKLRLALLDRQGVTCATCGKEETLPRRVYAHEEWEYDETTEPATARIVGVSLVCWHCHAVEHWGCTNAIATEHNLTRAIEDTIAHFCRLNGATEDAFKAHAALAQQTWRRRSKRKWRVDYGIFTEWTVKAFKRDILNDTEWPDSLQNCWADGYLPSMDDIISASSAATAH